MSLTKADTSQCQAETLSGSFMTYGPRRYVRCENKPTWIAKENKPPAGEKKRGSRSMCDDCRKVFLEQNGYGFASFRPISEKVRIKL